MAESAERQSPSSPITWLILLFWLVCLHNERDFFMIWAWLRGSAKLRWLVKFTKVSERCFSEAQTKIKDSWIQNVNQCSEWKWFVVFAGFITSAQRGIDTNIKSLLIFSVLTRFIFSSISIFAIKLKVCLFSTFWLFWRDFPKISIFSSNPQIKSLFIFNVLARFSSICNFHRLIKSLFIFSILTSFFIDFKFSRQTKGFILYL